MVLSLSYIPCMELQPLQLPIPTSPSPRIRDTSGIFLYDSARNLKSGRQTKEPEYKENGGK